MKRLLTVENIAVRVMYFFNVTDTFLAFSILSFFVCAQSGILSSFGFPPLKAPLFFVIAGMFFFYACCLIADFHVYFLVALPVTVLLANRVSPFWGKELLAAFFVFFLFTSCIQIIFMGLPMSLASRSPAVAVRMYLNSFLILAPTTISLPVTIGYQLIIVASVRGSLAEPLSWKTALICVSVLGLAALTRLFIKRGFLPPTFHPPVSGDGYKRAILINIDGLSYHAYKKSRADFLQRLEKKFASVAGGALTVYKAFTNPAFASILSGVEPARHGVMNNNLGRSIQVEALPDIIPTRLYGSMHVKHFSRKNWDVDVVSLVELSYDKADQALMDKFRKDLKNYPDIRLWVVDLSMADYCGHAWGSYSRQYYDAIERLDSLVKDFFDWCRKESFLCDTFFIISSDHGMFIGEHAYILSAFEERVPLIFVGRDIGDDSLSYKVSIIDIAANISYFLGRDYCKESRGRVFKEIIRRSSSNEFISRLGISVQRTQKVRK